MAARRWRHRDAAIRSASKRSARSRPLIDENQFKYSLDALCERYGLPGKDETLLARRSRLRASHQGGRRSTASRNTSGRLPARICRPLCRADAVNTLALYEKLDPILDREGTRDAYRLEVDLLPMVLEMRRRGIRIDQDAAEQARDLMLGKRDAALAELSERLGDARQHGRDRLAKMEGAGLRCARHRVSVAQRRAIRRSRPANPAGW